MPEFSLVWMVFAALLVWAAVTDITQLRIPNTVVMALGGLFLAVLLAAGFPEGWYWRFAVALGVLAGGIALFALNVMGAGDGKLLAVVALWAGPSHIVHVLVLTALLGVAVIPLKIAIGAGLTQLQLYVPQTAHWPLPKSVTKMKAVPYGVAIAGATLIASSLGFSSWLWVI